MRVAYQCIYVVTMYKRIKFRYHILGIVLRNFIMIFVMKFLYSPTINLDSVPFLAQALSLTVKIVV